eukprot:16644-Pelagococcus_subviridis.AAC.4
MPSALARASNCRSSCSFETPMNSNENRKSEEKSATAGHGGGLGGGGLGGGGGGWFPGSDSNTANTPNERTFTSRRTRLRQQLEVVHALRCLRRVELLAVRHPLVDERVVVRKRRPLGASRDDLPWKRLPRGVPGRVREVSDEELPVEQRQRVERNAELPGRAGDDRRVRRANEDKFASTRGVRLGQQLVAAKVLDHLVFAHLGDQDVRGVLERLRGDDENHRSVREDGRVFVKIRRGAAGLDGLNVHASGRERPAPLRVVVPPVIVHAVVHDILHAVHGDVIEIQTVAAVASGGVARARRGDVLRVAHEGTHVVLAKHRRRRRRGGVVHRDVIRDQPRRELVRVREVQRRVVHHAPARGVFFSVHDSHAVPGVEFILQHALRDVRVPASRVDSFKLVNRRRRQRGSEERDLVHDALVVPDLGVAVPTDEQRVRDGRGRRYPRPRPRGGAVDVKFHLVRRRVDDDGDVRPRPRDERRPGRDRDRARRAAIDVGPVHERPRGRVAARGPAASEGDAPAFVLRRREELDAREGHRLDPRLEREPAEGLKLERSLWRDRHLRVRAVAVEVNHGRTVLRRRRARRRRRRRQLSPDGRVRVERFAGVPRDVRRVLFGRNLREVRREAERGRERPELLQVRFVELPVREEVREIPEPRLHAEFVQLANLARRNRRVPHGHLVEVPLVLQALDRVLARARAAESVVLEELASQSSSSRRRRLRRRGLLLGGGRPLFGLGLGLGLGLGRDFKHALLARGLTAVEDRRAPSLSRELAVDVKRDGSRGGVDDDGDVLPDVHPHRHVGCRRGLALSHEVVVLEEASASPPLLRVIVVLVRFDDPRVLVAPRPEHESAGRRILPGAAPASGAERAREHQRPAVLAKHREHLPARVHLRFDPRLKRQRVARREARVVRSVHVRVPAVEVQRRRALLRRRARRRRRRRRRRLRIARDDEILVNAPHLRQGAVPGTQLQVLDAERVEHLGLNLGAAALVELVVRQQREPVSVPRDDALVEVRLDRGVHERGVPVLELVDVTVVVSARHAHRRRRRVLRVVRVDVSVVRGDVRAPVVPAPPGRGDPGARDVSNVADEVPVHVVANDRRHRAEHGSAQRSVFPERVREVTLDEGSLGGDDLFLFELVAEPVPEVQPGRLVVVRGDRDSHGRFLAHVLRDPTADVHAVDVQVHRPRGIARVQLVLRRIHAHGDVMPLVLRERGVRRKRVRARVGRP